VAREPRGFDMQGDDGTHSRNVVRIKMLIMVAMADGHWDDREVALLEQLAEKFAIGTEELAEVRKRPDLDVHELSAGLPADNRGRIDMLANLIKMAYADRELHDHELRLLIRLGRVLGFDEDAVRGIVEEEGRT